MLRAVLALFCLWPPTPIGAQRIADIPRSLMVQVFPDADRFAPHEGTPPVFAAWRTDDSTDTDALVGYVFHTADVPPERRGYSGPIEALVGMDLEGRLTGVRVLNYWESLMSSMGDFLRRRGVQEQFRGKHIGDAFQARRDVEAVSRATISTEALAMGARDAARRVAAAHLTVALAEDVSSVVDVEDLDWLALRQRGVVAPMVVTHPGGAAMEVTFAYMENDSFAVRLVGEDALAMSKRAWESVTGSEGHLMFYGLDGPDVRLFRREGWALVQGGDTLPVPPDAIRAFGLASGGMLEAQVVAGGVMILEGTLDVTRPFRIVYDYPESGPPFSIEYRTEFIRRAAAEALAARNRTPELRASADTTTPPGERATTPAGEDPPTSAGSASTDSVVELASPQVGRVDAGGDPAVRPRSGSEEPASASEEPGSQGVDPGGGRSNPGGERVAPPPSTEAAPPEPSTGSEGSARGPTSVDSGVSGARVTDADARDTSGLFTEESSQTVLARTVSNTDPLRVALVLALWALALATLRYKRDALRWVTLVGTFALLGFWDGGFLSVSHLTSALWVGPGVFLNDLPLLLMVVFTLATTLVWGRVFCGYLCPFGALQDLLDRWVPRALRRDLPHRVHRAGLSLKYGVLLFIVVWALVADQSSVYAYFEPFGTVFFLSRSPLLWTIAGLFLVSSVIIPRFYCRYVCPLGAALAVGSLISLRRIPRVPHCTHCKVCEQDCPTGAITGPEIDFKECVRCNDCETKLSRRVGVCRHDIADVRQRLVQVEDRRRARVTS